MGSTKEHTALVDATLIELGKRPDLGCFLPRQTGAYELPSGAYLRYGNPGWGDIYGVLKNGYATHCEGEAKTGKAVQSDDQKKCQARVIGLNGIYIVFHSPKEFITQIEEALARYK